jgi:hypothetical protein
MDRKNENNHRESGSSKKHPVFLPREERFAQELHVYFYK